jgi:hypothetical protein
MAKGASGCTSGRDLLGYEWGVLSAVNCCTSAGSQVTTRTQCSQRAAPCNPQSRVRRSPLRRGRRGQRNPGHVQDAAREIVTWYTAQARRVVRDTWAGWGGDSTWREPCVRASSPAREFRRRARCRVRNRSRSEETNAIAGFGYFVSFSVLPDWLAWDTFGEANGVASLADLRARLGRIRDGASIEADRQGRIGCSLIAEARFFPPIRVSSYRSRAISWPRNGGFPSCTPVTGGARPRARRRSTRSARRGRAPSRPGSV